MSYQGEHERKARALGCTLMAVGLGVLFGRLLELAVLAVLAQ